MINDQVKGQVIDRVFDQVYDQVKGLTLGQVSVQVYDQVNLQELSQWYLLRYQVTYQFEEQS